MRHFIILAFPVRMNELDGIPDEIVLKHEGHEGVHYSFQVFQVEALRVFESNINNKGMGAEGVKGIRGIRRNKQLSLWWRTTRAIPLRIPSKSWPTDTANQNTSALALGRFSCTELTKALGVCFHPPAELQSFVLPPHGVFDGAVN